MMDVFELSEEERYGDDCPHKNPKKPSRQRIRRIERGIVKEAIGKPKITEK